MSKILVEVSARLNSTRLPSKDAFNLGGKPTFFHIFERVKEHLPDADYYFLNIPNFFSEDPLYFLGKAYGYEVFRGSERRGIRRQELFNYLGLKDDDIVYSPSCDDLFAYTGHVPFIIQKLRETNKNCMHVIRVKDTISTGIGMDGSWCLWTGEGFRTFYGSNARFHFRDEDLGWYDRCALRPILLEPSGRFLQPWPWAPLSLDYPNQAIQIRMIFDTLYKGKPIEPEEIYALFKERPLLANLVPPGIPLTKGSVYPLGVGMDESGIDFTVEQLKKCTDHIILEWKDG